MEKYRAKKTEIDWIKFSSLLEWRFYKYFRDNHIKIIELQPRFILQDKVTVKWEKLRKIEYVADFHIVYNWVEFIIDAKWLELDIFRLKIKIWKKLYWEDYNLIIATSIKDLQQKLEFYKK